MDLREKLTAAFDNVEAGCGVIASLAHLEALVDAALAAIEPALAAERERCAAFVHELWEYGVPAQEFAQRIRAFDS